ncbi:hypothetical protein PanWU01x14_262290, partial [Parasponia andersonii]
VWRASAQIYDMVPSGTLWSSRGHYGSYGNTLTAVWGGPLLYTEGIFWGSRPPYSS